MITMRHHTIRRSRGSVIVLVVAVLALLAVIGTVYIVSARAERTSAQSGQVAINLEYAVDAANRLAISAMSDSMYDTAGTIAGTDVNPGPYGTFAASRWTIPYVNMHPTIQGASHYNDFLRDTPWLVSNTYRSAAMGTAVTSFDAINGPHYNDLTVVTPSAFNPSSGAYDLGAYYTPAATPNAPLFSNSVVSNAFATNLPAPGTPFPYDPYVSPAAGVTADQDAFINLLPFSEASGIRYRVGFRIIDTSRMANLNVGTAEATVPANTFFTDGTFPGVYLLGAPSVQNPMNTSATGFPDVPANLNATPVGRFGANSPPPSVNPGAWFLATMNFENPEKINAPLASSPLAPFDLADELELRLNGDRGSPAMPRVAFANAVGMTWPNTLGNRQIGTTNPPNRNPFRNFFTAYSYSRELNPFPTPNNPYQINGSNNWPRNPARIPANPIFGLTGNDELLAAITATNIATSMEKIAGYSHQEACAYAVNYVTHRLNGWVSTANGYSLPNGPSVLESGGFVINTTALPALITSDLSALEANKIYMGYAPQPFISEVACTHTTVADPMAPTGFSNTISDSAVELYNPYDFPLDLSDYQLVIMDGATPGAPIDLTTMPSPTIKARGYFVITMSGGANHLDSLVAGPNSTKGQSPTLTFSKTGGEVRLLRKYRGSAGAAYGAIDTYDYSPIGTKPPAAAPGDEDWYQHRGSQTNPNAGTPPAAADWFPTTHTAFANVAHSNAAPAAPELMTLGDTNPKDPLGAGVSLGEATPDTAPITSPLALFNNIAAFNRIPRIASEIDKTTGFPMLTTPATDHGTISQQLTTMLTGGPSTPFTADSQSIPEANLFFDFRTDPIAFNTQGNAEDLFGTSPPMPPPSTPKAGDLRAQRLLETLAFIDRVQNTTVDIGDGPTGISKLRIPGQINVNTAPPEVLETIPALSAANKKYVTAILAYRWRTKSTDPRIPVAYQALGAFDFSDPAKYPGYGIRSLGELLVPLTDETLPTLAARDQIWASIYNCLTVRSDTFVLYGYLEAVKANPNYPTHNNGTDWYGPVVDDPRGNNTPNVRVARRRWVAIIDTSYCNFSRNNGFVMPRIVALKDITE